VQRREFEVLREKMVKEQLIERGIKDRRVLDVFGRVEREKFVPPDKQEYAYEDSPLYIGWGQTISQPYIVALMTELLSLKGGEKVLEIGTGSGYQSAILSHLGCVVYTVERIPQLAKKAEEILSLLGYRVKVKIGDGTLGWEEFAPYDRIIITAASSSVSLPLIKQLKIGGKIVLPLGERLHQELTVIDKVSSTRVEKKAICGCIFVPLIGKYGYKR